MTCQELIALLDRYLVGELSADEQEQVRHHLSVCPPCVNYSESYRRTVELAADTIDPAGQPEPRDVPPAVLAAIIRAARDKASHADGPPPPGETSGR